jgi:creatinine amidohydrolase
MTTYLKDFKKFSQKGVAYIPIGTLEWHSTHLPIETDFLVAQKLCEIVSQKFFGYILPPIYLGSSTKKKIKGKWFIGMDKFLEKKLAGNLYYLEPELFVEVLTNLCNNLLGQGFRKIFIITGHGGRGQAKALALVKKKMKKIVIINPYDILGEKITKIDHADEYETSLLWACYPEEEKNGRKNGTDADYLRYKGYDPLKKSSLKLGQKVLGEMLKGCLKIVSRELK